jgi:hypothetical protein
MKELADNILTLDSYLVAQQKEVSATGAWTRTKKALQMALEVECPEVDFRGSRRKLLNKFRHKAKFRPLQARVHF